MHLKIEAITVCVNYTDFLRETLPLNLPLFDRLIVVTSFDDRATQDYCRQLSVECRATDVMSVDGGGGFAKGRAIDWGIGFLQKNGWICHLDADVVLPPMARHMIESARPDEEAIYGCDRVNCIGYENWRQYKAKTLDAPDHLHQRRHHCLIEPPPFPMGARLCLPEHGGVIPIGFFQLWHARHGRRYPFFNTSAEHSDAMHALQWPTAKRHLLEEIVAIHLESEPTEMGANWNGRTTRPFRPGHHDHHGRHHHGHHHHHPKPYLH